MLGMFKKNSVKKIAKTIPLMLVETYEKQDFYSAEQVKSTFDSAFKYEHNLAYAFAMFCTQAEFDSLSLNESYETLRLDVAKKCFGSWPRFNFNSLLDYARNAKANGDGGFFGGDGGCGGGE